MQYLLLGTSLTIASIAAWYSIAGLMAIFAGAAIPIAIMASALEVGKLVTASWLHSNWKVIPVLLRVYLTSAVIILMFITSMGIFGFLSNAHLDSSVKVVGTNDLKIENLERQIERQQGIIADAETVLDQLDQAVATLIQYDRIRGPEGSIAVRESQKEERQDLNNTIDAAYQRIEGLQNELIPLQQDKLSFEVEVGPLKYIAEIIYGKDQSSDNLDNAVRWVIFLLIFVFDPLAVILLIAATRQMNQKRKVEHWQMFTPDGDPLDFPIDESK